MYLKSIFHILAVTALLAPPLLAQNFTYKPGGGVQLFSEEEQWKFRLLGYAQSTYNFHTVHENGAIDNEFYIRRARLDFIFDYKNRYQIFFELDARGSRTEMVLAQFDVKYFRHHKIQIGKFITPFSPENTRSSRGLSSVERYSGLNSLFLLPALDTQYGIMFYGKVRQIDYYLSITNGNGKASANIPENNSAKDVQGRLVYHLSEQFSIGGSANYADEESQTLKLVDHTFNSFNEAQTGGKRLGYLLDFNLDLIPFSLRGEAFQYNFDAALSGEQQVQDFRGGFAEAGYFLSGNKNNGLQLIGRVETAQYDRVDQSLAGPTQLHSFIVGNNWYKDNIFRLQVNLIYELANRDSQLMDTRFAGQDNSFEILTMLQLKF